MRSFLNSIHKIEDKFDRKAEYFAFHHPLLAFWAMFLGMPVVILTVVSAGTIAIGVPIAVLMGWW